MKVCVGIPYKCKLNGRYPFHIYLLELLLIMETIDWHWSVMAYRNCFAMYIWHSVRQIEGCPDAKQLYLVINR